MDVQLLLTWIMTNFLDIVILYFVVSKLVKQKVTIDAKKGLFALGYAMAFGLLTYLTDRSVFYQITAFIATFVIIFWMMKKNLTKSIIVAILYFFVNAILHIPVLIPSLLFNLEYTNLMRIGVLSLIAALAIISYKTIPLDKLLVFVEKHVGATILVSISTTFFLVFVLYFNPYPDPNLNVNFWKLLAIMFMNLCDLMAIYFLSTKLVKRLIMIDLKNIMIAILYAVIFGIFHYLTDRSAIYQILAATAQFIIIYSNIKRSFESSLIIFGLSYSMLTLFEILLELISLSFALDLFAAIPTLAVILAIFTYKLAPINKLFDFIEKHLLLKLVIFILAFIVTLIVLFYNISFSGNIWFILAGIGLMIAFFISLWAIGREIYRLTYLKPLSEHDLKISFYGSLIKAYKEEDHQQIEILEKMGKKNSFDLGFDFQLGKAKENILEFIHFKLSTYEQEVEIISDIAYHKDHHTVGIDILVKLLGVLLENALESGTKKPVIINFRVDLGNINIEVSNEYHLTAPDAIYRMFDHGFSTKGAGRGFGLDNLNRAVKAFGGEVLTSHDFNKTMATDYLTLSIEI